MGKFIKKSSLDNQSLLPDFYFKLAILYNIMSKTEDVYMHIFNWNSFEMMIKTFEFKIYKIYI